MPATATLPDTLTERASRSVDLADRPGVAAAADDRLGALEAALAEVAALPVDALSEAAAHQEVAVLERVRRRLEARTVRLTGHLTALRIAENRRRNPDDRRGTQRIVQEVRRELATALRVDPGRVKRAQDAAKIVEAAPGAGLALDAGELTIDQVRSLDNTLRHLAGDQRERVAQELIERARHEDPVEFGDSCRRRLTQLDHDAAMADHDRLHGQRRASVTRGRDGRSRVWAELVGLDAEIAHVAVNAFRRHDLPEEHRSPAQRTADALGDVFRAAVRVAGAAPNQPAIEDSAASAREGSDPQHGVTTSIEPGAATVDDNASRPAAPSANHRVHPHISVIVDLDTLLNGEGVAETGWAGPVPWGAVRHLLHEAGLGFIAVRGEVPVAVTGEGRHVPRTLYRALIARDGGCIREGCDARPEWCQVMHLDRAYRHQGRLGLENGALGCTRHHRLFDRHELRLDWNHGRPILRPP